MRSDLKLLLILCSVLRAEGRWTSWPTATSPDEDQGSGRPTEAPGVPAWTRPVAVAPVQARPRRSTPLSSPCGLRSVLLPVRDLGLGYDSDEAVLFKYCGGTCPRVPRSNHDLTLANLQLSGLLPQPAPGEPRHAAPCCRPTLHEDAAFLDNSHRWHKVEKLSAAGCSCVG